MWFMLEKEETREKWASLWEGGWGPEGGRGPAGDASGRESRGVQQAERSRPGLRRMGNSLCTQKQFRTLLGSLAFRVNFWCLALFCILCQSCNHVIYTSVWDSVFPHLTLYPGRFSPKLLLISVFFKQLHNLPPREICHSLFSWSLLLETRRLPHFQCHK